MWWVLTYSVFHDRDSCWLWAWGQSRIQGRSWGGAEVMNNGQMWQPLQENLKERNRNQILTPFAFTEDLIPALEDLGNSLTGQLCGSVLFFLLSRGSSIYQKVIQFQPTTSRHEGGVVELDNSYDTGIAYYVLYWYERLPSSEMIFLIFQHKNAESSATHCQYSVNFQKATTTIGLITSPS